ncbi:dTDP-4-amino-4,6-dideoxy-D-galactose acyltransferase [Yersinia pekkanenii]|uniref:dTDP-fucosamine acetyltransferase n=1 Tax=Yersinia pekkanenii TaxID=1288385 RepID=A0A0T9NTJ9_9GAMM|nr:dTDP-4-amino-4,6-dideoxy-D-galactose acyltransferase [Yersinia pekkanenii]CNH27368.1 TDP-fucosamine acetyltransferase [Yersinia pekkanenii]CRY67267.1 TDP-fucosamine acetyltransferase [Yersinia pekkanenii]
MSVHASIEPLGWESDFFQRHSAKLIFSDSAPLLDPAELGAFTLTQAKVPTHRLDLIDSLGQLGFQLVEGEVSLSLPVDIKNGIGTENASSSVAATTHKFRVATVDDIPLLRSVCAGAFALSRFRAPWYDPQDSGRFYALWVEKAVLGTFDHQCLMVMDAADQPAGFVTLRDLQDGSARIGLLAVFPDAQGKGIGSALMSTAKQWCYAHGLHRLRVATQMSNIAALRLYIRSGAVIESTAYWLCRG